MNARNLKKIIILTSLFPALTSAQSYYPGGLGNSNLILWLDANKLASITKNAFNQVSQWSDLSGNANHFTQATMANQPVYGATANPLSEPGLTFTSLTSQYLSRTSMSATSFTGGLTAFSLVSYNATSGSGWQRIFDFGNGQASNNFMMGRYGTSANAYFEGWNAASGDQTYTTSAPIVNGSENLFEAIQQAGTAGTLSNVTHYVSGTAQAAAGQAGSSKTYLPNAIVRTSNYIGRSNWSADEYFSGTMSEIFLYNTAVSTTQRVILENYISTKWQKTISSSRYTPPSATTYTTNLVGIGYTSSTDNFLANIAGSTDGLGFSSTTTGFLSTAGYLMAAHNAQANTEISNATVPMITSASPLFKWNRSWNIQQTSGNSAGAANVIFNFSDYNGATPVTTYTYALLYNATDGTFASGTNTIISTTGTTVSGNTVTFSATASNLPNGYYTILYSNSNILSVDLVSFSATKDNTYCRLQWTLEGLSGPHQVAIGRSADGHSFSAIDTVSTLSSATAYSYLDRHPLPGMNQYRLAILSGENHILYSPIQIIDFGSGSSMNVFPNPASDFLHVTFSNPSEQMQITLLDLTGKAVRTTTTHSPSTLLSIHDLAPGIYIVQVKGKRSLETFKICKI